MPFALPACPPMPNLSHAPDGEAAHGAAATRPVRLLRACAARTATAVPGAVCALATYAVGL